MLKKIYSSIKKYFISPEAIEGHTVFEKVKIDLLLNLFLIFSLIYILGIVRIVSEGYWYIFIGRLVGLLFMFLFIYAFKKTQSYKTPGLIWVLSIVFLGLYGMIVNAGALTFANLGFSFLNIALIVILFKNSTKIILFIYYVIFLSVGLSFKFGVFEKLSVSSVFGHDQTFAHRNLLFSIVPFLLLVHVLYIFVTYESKIDLKLGEQIDFARDEEEKLNMANESMQKSVKLASRVQKAFLPNLDYYQSFFSSYFLFLKPQHELSGDFYWATAIEDSLYIAIIDSSENNIAGAIVSSLYFDALDATVKEQGISRTNEIIQALNHFIKEKADIKSLKDGIQISVLRICRKEQKIFFAGEKNSIFHSKKSKKVIDEYKSQQIYSNGSEVTYKEIQLDYDKGDSVYVTTDGLPHSFRGFKNVKFKESVFKTFLTSIKRKPLDVQRQLLEEQLLLWNGEDNQSDDVCMIGITL